ncbi:MAG TPA: ferritin-like domain-containing protein [Polyangia bacterium]
MSHFARLFLSRLVANRRGRAFLLSFMADAEESDEGAFDRLVASADASPELSKLVRTHGEDEARHARLLRDCLGRVGVTPEPLPPELRYIDRLDRLTDGKFRRGFLADDGAVGVMKVYALLQIVEERGVGQFPLIARAFDAVDADTARTIDAIVADEERHVRYARAITQRYAPDAATLADALAEFRALEARAFADHGRDFFAWAAAHDLVGISALERAGWRAIALATRALPAYGGPRRAPWRKRQDIRIASAPR